jgi:hypothetical protein
MAGSDKDFGLAIGARVKVIKSALVTKPGSGPKASMVYSLRFKPDDTNEFVCATSAGIVKRTKRFGVTSFQPYTII